jgi:hypothetical protein
MQRNKTDSVMISISPAFKMAGDFFCRIELLIYLKRIGFYGKPGKGMVQ